MPGVIGRLIEVKKELQDIDFYVAGSLALYLNGVRVEPGDLDLYFWIADKDKVVGILGGSPEMSKGSPRMQIGSDPEVDIVFLEDIGEFETKRVGGEEFKVLTLEQLKKYYEFLERPEKVKIVNEALDAL